MLGIAFLCGYRVARRLLIRRLHLPAGPVDLFISLLILGGFFGSKLFTLLFEMSVPVDEIPSYLFGFRAAGVTFFGGFIIDLLVTLIFIWKYKINFWELTDILVLPVAFGLGLTRIGCFLAGCCWGKPADIPWGVVVSNPEAITPLKHISLHPAQLYHSLANFLIFFILLIIYIKYKNRPRGFIFTLFLLLYSSGRFITEFFRGDMARGYVFDILSTSQFISLIAFILAMLKLASMISRREFSRMKRIPG